MNATATSVQPIAQSLGRVSKRWLDPADPLRQEAVIALQVSTGFTRAMIEAALTAAFEALTLDKLLSFHSHSLSAQIDAPGRVLHILASNVFTSWLPGAVITLLLGSECDLKPSLHEPVFAAFWKRSVEAVDPALAERIQIVQWRDNLMQGYTAVVAYGSDATLAALRRETPPHVRFVEYGHKLSVAVIWKEALTPDAWPQLADRLESDVSPFDLQGCLSPQVLYLEDEDPGLFEALYSRVRVMPQIKRFESWEGLKAEWKSFQSHLSTLGYAGPSERMSILAADLSGLGFSRVCPVGEMQRPPLTWRNGGISLVGVLTER